MTLIYSNIKLMLSKKILSIPLILFSLLTASPALAAWTIDLLPPTCSITFSTVDATHVSISVLATDSSGISAINLFQGSSTTAIASSTSSPLSYTWSNTGSPSFSAIATDGVGNTNSASPCANSRTAPYLKTTGGDVHSNTNINIPPGP